MKILKIIGIITFSILVLIQFIPVKLPISSNDNPNDLLTNNAIPDSISTLLKNGCYDCHSNQTRYLWYSYVKPTAWLISRDTKEGRTHLNFSDWESMTIKNKLKVLSETAEVVEAKEMPYPPYLLIHKNARFTKEERERLIKWTEDFGESLFNE